MIAVPGNYRGTTGVPSPPCPLPPSSSDLNFSPAISHFLARPSLAPSRQVSNPAPPFPKCCTVPPPKKTGPSKLALTRADGLSIVGLVGFKIIGQLLLSTCLQFTSKSLNTVGFSCSLNFDSSSPVVECYT